MAARTKHDRDDDRRTIIAALTETGQPLRIHELLRDAWGIDGDHFTREAHMRTDLRALERGGKIIAEWTRGGMWMQYRLATADDLDAESDRKDIEQQAARWQPSDGGYSTAAWDGSLA